MGKGDVLASGGRKATFPSLSHVSQDKWESIFGPPEPKKKAKKNVGKK